jgi:regulator of replication initiation timing
VPPESRWYPPKTNDFTFDQFNAHRVAFDKIYELEDQLKELHGKHQELHAKMQGATKENEKLKEIINNRIAGRLVKPKEPQDGETIRYNSASGQFVFGA